MTRVRGRVRVDHPKGWFVVEMRESGLTVWRKGARTRYPMSFEQTIARMLDEERGDREHKIAKQRAAAWSRVSRRRDANQLPLITP